MVEERAELAREYFVEILPRLKSINNKITALACGYSEGMTIKSLEELLQKYEVLEKEKFEVENRSREIWDRILEINRILKSR